MLLHFSCYSDPTKSSVIKLKGLLEDTAVLTVMHLRGIFQLWRQDGIKIKLSMDTPRVQPLTHTFSQASFLQCHKCFPPHLQPLCLNISLKQDSIQHTSTELVPSNLCAPHCHLLRFHSGLWCFIAVLVPGYERDR